MNRTPPDDRRAELALKGGFLLLALLVLVLDQWTKWLVELHLPHLASHRLIPGLLNLTHVRNTGVAFGLFAAQGDGARTLVLSAVGLLALGIVLWYFWQTPSRDRLLLASLSLVLGGAVGNLFDRLASGAVTDFVDFYVGTYHWHTFNVADSAITVGLVLMAWDAFRPRVSDFDDAAEEEVTDGPSPPSSRSPGADGEPALAEPADG